ncbi:GNAT family N-acetyltransferase [Neorhizobium galegae]|uniref:GNAT family N-acetyltransferase n=1 Tax=Neorhizobium galegae TaxID=399 RepID=UPI0006215136|nr:GNAT family protein [Neorhizobium galegae]CDZ64460.1 Putative cog1670, acetyltransferase protein [Neorhizobium galegae bv. orientalis]MCQ1570262.1 GNAT family N-acetyltransferase [Neorhizobium galegae]MCQ1810762.1 GNAT family N-acetyltransferase [Neorhizobium galegae]MCQ1838049.1 GNAT family N-acetyltransferase [Neorhizobium galegae]CDZ67873.1 Putative cog1670, acetyltransferase protein [Neorhizobium galegae bv. orientalis]
MLNLDRLPANVVGKKVKMVALNETHRAALMEIAKDERIWRHYPLDGTKVEVFNAWFDESLFDAIKLVSWPFVVYNIADERLIGSARFESIAKEHDRLSVGGTWLHPSAWRKGFNTEMNYLLFDVAFEILGAKRVEVRVDARNEANLSGMRSFGATEEGTLRQFYLEQDGYRTDRVIFSVMQNEWPVVKTKMANKLDGRSP